MFPVRYAVIRMDTTGRKRTPGCAGTVNISGIPSNTVPINVTRELRAILHGLLRYIRVPERQPGGTGLC